MPTTLLTWEEPYKSRRKETGLLMYSTLGIAKEDKQRQMEQWKLNYRAFDAPVVLYFFIDVQQGTAAYQIVRRPFSFCYSH